MCITHEWIGVNAFVCGTLRVSSATVFSWQELHEVLSGLVAEFHPRIVYFGLVVVNGRSSQLGSVLTVEWLTAVAKCPL